MRRLKLILAYDGTPFHGFQRQDNAVTVQEVLETALGRAADHPVTLVPAGRTDTGVHAAAQVVHCDISGGIPTERIAKAVNSMLPPDVVVYEVVEAAADFHARYDALSKVYRYSILLSDFAWPFIRRYVFHHPPNLDVQAMIWAAHLFKGEKEFAAFQAAGSTVQDTRRHLMRVDVQQQKMDWGRLVHFEFEGNGFLYHMVRIIIGTLLEVGRGRRSLAAVESLFETGDRTAAGPTAEASGLTLLQVKYADQSAAGEAASKTGPKRRRT
ncbi:MAG: tRNA pseudouridine(38-40) synthase TruA [Thermaerobacterales bacterium]